MYHFLGSLLKLYLYGIGTLTSMAVASTRVRWSGRGLNQMHQPDPYTTTDSFLQLQASSITHSSIKECFKYPLCGKNSF
ncbi:hypothetical protein QLX08_005853 [Tetragonisca angustula]|uniref:Secreted protein n=1 Tax=Tetragonisca angustula TaxID=166442 RepID=A0AAW0ZWS0_9HYME